MSKRKAINLTHFPVPRKMRREEAIAYLSGEQVLDDAIAAGVLKPCAQPSCRMTFFRTSDVLAVDAAIAEGNYPGRRRA